MDDWDGVTVGGSTKRVIHIELNDMGLSGEIPAELASLQAMEVLVLSDNELVGTNTIRAGQACEPGRSY